MAKKRVGISEEEFVAAVKELYPNALFHQLDDKDFDDVWIRGIGYWEADRVLYSRSDRNIRMWRNFGGYDRHFKNLAVFKEWLKNAHANNRKFEETSEAAKSLTWTESKEGYALCYDVPAGNFHSCNGAQIKHWKYVNAPSK